MCGGISARCSAPQTTRAPRWQRRSSGRRRSSRPGGGDARDDRPAPGRGAARARRDRQPALARPLLRVAAQGGRRDERGEPRSVRGSRAGRRPGAERASLLRARVARAGGRPRRPAGGRAGGGGRPPLPRALRRFPAAHAVRARGARAGRARSRRGQRLAGVVRPDDSTIEVPFDGGDGEEPHTVDRLLAYVHDPRRDVRRRRETLYAALEPHSRCWPIYDSLVGDRLVLDRLRRFATPIYPDAPAQRARRPGRRRDAGRGRGELPDRPAVVPAKAGVLGLDKLELHDQYAPVGETPATSATTRPARS